MPEFLIFSLWPEWLQYLVRGLMLFAMIAFSTIILTRAGRSPYWAVVVIIPNAVIVALWVFAFTVWPKRQNAGQKPNSTTNGA